jgi:hypothetical protein
MTIDRRVLLALIVTSSVGFAPPLMAASKKIWDGTWSGSWGGQADTSVTISGKKVVTYTYKGAAVPITHSKVSDDTVMFGSATYTVTITKTGDTTATAQYHSPVNGDASALLTKQ